MVKPWEDMACGETRILVNTAHKAEEEPTEEAGQEHTEKEKRRSKGK